MATTLTEVSDLFLSNITDWKLDTLFTTGSSNFNTYIEPWLLNSIEELSPISTQDLTYTVVSGSTDGYFDQTLTMKNQLVLSNIMIKYWMRKHLNDVQQFTNFLTDREFKMSSPANNLNAKLQAYNQKVEEVSQMLIDYAYLNNSWENWRNQIFY